MKSTTNLLLLLLGICSASTQVWSLPASDYDDYNADDADNDPDDYPSTPGKMLSQNQEFIVNIGATVKLPCKIEGKDDVQWTRGPSEEPLYLGELKQTEDRRYSMDLKDFTLTILSVNISDSDEFHCRIMEPTLRASVTHTLKVKSGPVITKTVPEKDRVEEKEGSPMTFMCETNGVPKPKVYWMINNHLHKGAQKIDSDHFSYDKLTWRHSGNYTCFAEQDKETVRKMIHLTVQGSPDVTVVAKHVNSAEHYESELICNIHCTGCHIVRWEKEGKEIKPDRHFTLLQEGHRHILRISATKKSDFGEYSCIAENRIGRSSGSIHLKGQPMKPTLEKLSAGENGKSSITWKVVSKGEVKGYEINYKKQTEDEWKAINPAVQPGNNGIYHLTHEFDIPSDIPKDTYKARLRAQNDYGFSELSDEVPFPAGGNEDMPKEGPSVLEENGGNGASHLELRLSVMFIVALLTARFLQ